MIFYLIFAVHLIRAQSCINKHDTTYTGSYHHRYQNWEDMAREKLERALKSSQTVREYRQWVATTNKKKAPSVHYISDFDMDRVDSKLQVVTACDPRSLVILLDASLMQYEKLKSEEINIWSMLSIFTYQQIAQRLTTMHALDQPFRTLVAVYGRTVEVLLDRKIQSVDDIQAIFTEKVMGEDAIYRFFNLAKEIRSSEEIQKHAEQAIRTVSNLITETVVLTVPVPFHWVIVTDRVQVKHLALTKEFNIDTLSNVKLNNREILLTTSNPDGTHLVSLINDGGTDVFTMDQDVIGWNIDMETSFCRIDPHRIFFLAFNDDYKMEHDERKAARLRRFPTPPYLAEHGKRIKRMMKMLGPESDALLERSILTPPEPISLPTDYNMTRSGCRGRRVSPNLDDQLDKFFGVYDSVKLLTPAGKLMFYSSGGPRGQWVQRSFKFTNQYFELMDRALEGYGLEKDKSKFVTENGMKNYEEYKQKGDGIFTQSDENRLWNWGGDEVEQELHFIE